MPSRKVALEAFYSSDIWKHHREAVNETLVDNDNVLHDHVRLELAAGAEVIAELVTEASDNNFPALPVREGETVFVRLARVADRDARSAMASGGDRSPGRRCLERELQDRLKAPPQTLRLAPTARSGVA